MQYWSSDKEAYSLIQFRSSWVFDLSVVSRAVSKKNYRYFHAVLNGVLRLQGDYFKKPEPIQSNSTDKTWKHFKNCLEALDGTHIKMTIPVDDRPKYRNRRGEITTNVLGACSPNLQFQYVLTGWEGSAADGRVLRDAIYRHRLIVPTGTYYLVDAGYTNGEGFLAPFRGERYHLNDWDDDNQPTSAREYYNMMHSSARNVIERCFGILKKRWAILRSPSFYPVKTQNRIVLASCILHNYIRIESEFDQAEIEFDQHGPEDHHEQNEHEADEDHITTVGTSDAWTTFRNNLADSMLISWNH
nr:PREDICTED: putative nuclease HARBI1 [Daucus carota subsp. sativus]